MKSILESNTGVFFQNACSRLPKAENSALATRTRTRHAAHAHAGASASYQKPNEQNGQNIRREGPISGAVHFVLVEHGHEIGGLNAVLALHALQIALERVDGADAEPRYRHALVRLVHDHAHPLLVDDLEALHFVLQQIVGQELAPRDLFVLVVVVGERGEYADARDEANDGLLVAEWILRAAACSARAARALGTAGTSAADFKFEFEHFLLVVFRRLRWSRVKRFAQKVE